MTSPTISTASHLLDTLRWLGHFSAEELRQAEELAARHAEATPLARELMNLGLLTAFQVNRLLPGRAAELVLGNYVLLERLGEGGMGAVYKARSRKLGRTVAVKVIRKERLTHPDAVRRFHREIQACAHLSHPNIIHAFDAGEEQGTHFFVMEYVEGTDLGALLKKQALLPVPAVCAYIRQAALGLQHAHEKGLVHRDVKPSNLFLCNRGAGSGPNGVVKVLDLGLARISDDPDHSGTLTDTGAVMGTPDYMAPEQILDTHAADVRADLYSLGCTLYQLLSGQVPFPGKTVGHKLFRHQTETARPIEELRPEVSPALAAIVRKLMAKKPEDRFQAPAELVEALDGASSPTPVSSEDTFANLSSTASVPPSPTVASPRRWLVAGSAAAVLLAGAVVGLVLLSRRPGPAPAPGPAPVLDQTSKAGDKGPGISPWDGLDARLIPKEELFDFQPPELVAVLGEHRLRHWGAVRAVAVCGPENRWIASAGVDRVIRLWGRESGREEQVLSGHTATIIGLSASANGLRLASAATDNTVRLWDLTMSRPPIVLEVGKDVPQAVALSSDGNLVAAGGAGKVIHVWGLAGGKPVKQPVLTGHKETVRGLAFAPGSKLLASAGDDRSVLLWDLAGKSDQAIARLEAHKDRALAVAFSSDGKQLASTSFDGQGYLWAVAGKDTRRIDSFQATGTATAAVAFRPDGKTLACGGSHKPIHLFRLADTTGLEQGAVLRGHHDSVHALAFTPDGKALFSGGADSTVRVWLLGPPGPREKWQLAGHQGPVNQIAFSPSGELLSCGVDGTVRLWGPKEGQFRQRELFGGPGPSMNVRGLAVSRDGKWLAAPGPGSRINLWGLTGPKATLRPSADKAPGEVQALAFSPDSKWLATVEQPGAIRLWKREKGRLVEARALVNERWPGQAVAFLPDQPAIAFASYASGIKLANLEGPAKPKEALRPLVYSQTFALSPDGNTLVAPKQTLSLEVWKRRQTTYEHDRSIPAPSGGQVSALAVSPDGLSLATADDQGQLILWDTSTWAQRKAWKLPHKICHLAFAPDNRHLATANANGTIYVLRLAGPRLAP
jgi:WD40 repeat protein/serine/threonine protein kinase